MKKKRSLQKRPDYSIKSENTIPKSHVSVDFLQKRDQVSRDKKLIRKQIKSDFYELIKTTGDDIKKVASFISKYSNNLNLVTEALSDRKYQTDFYSRMIWGYLLGEHDQLNALKGEVLTQKLVNERKIWVETVLPKPLLVKIPTTPNGPIFESVTSQSLRKYICSFLVGYSGIEVSGTFPLIGEGTHSILLSFNDGVTIELFVELMLDNEPLPNWVLERFQALSLIPIGYDVDVIAHFQQLIEKDSPSDILNYYPALGNILYTSYKMGYWKNEIVRNFFVEWEKRYDEYVLNIEIQRIRSVVDDVNQAANLIPLEEDDENLDRKKIELMAIKLLEEKSSFPLEKVGVVCSDSEFAKKSIINVDITLGNIPIGKIHLNRATLFLPQSVRKEIFEIEIPYLLDRLRSIKSLDSLIDAADNETKHAVDHLSPDAVDPDLNDMDNRANHLAVICRVLMERGDISSWQFKRTLTSYYAARGQETLDDHPLQSRRYLLLFYRMIFQEKVNQHLKAIKPFDYPVLGNLLATYLESGYLRSKTTPPSSTHIKHRDLVEQKTLLWRAAQLLSESPLHFFSAILEMYTIEENFVKTLLASMIRCEKIDKYSFNYLIPGNSNNIISDLVEFALKYTAPDLKTSNLLEFIQTILDTKDLAQPLLNIEKMVDSARTFALSKNIVHRSTLYTDIDREYIQCRSSLDKLINQYRNNPDARNRIVRTLGLLSAFKKYVDDTHREFFSSAKLVVDIDTATIPYNSQSQIEIFIHNVEYGLASNVIIKIEKNSSFILDTYEKLVAPYFSGEERVEYINITPLSNGPLEIRGEVQYSDQEGTKSCFIRQTLAVSNPEEFVSFSSPYITGVPVHATDMFFGRRKELEEVISLLRGHFQDRVIAIYGQRKIGKTSLLYQLQKGDPDLLSVEPLQAIREFYIPVYIDFERFPSETNTWEIYYKIYSEIYRQMSEKGYDCQAKIELERFREVPPDSLLEEYVYEATKCLKPEGKKLLLLLDEFDNLIKIGGEQKGIFGLIRELVNKYSEMMSFVFVGADSMVDMMMAHANRLYSMASTLEIPRLNDDEARRLIIEPMQKRNPEFEWSPRAVKLLINYTDKHPYFIQVLCDGIVQKLLSDKRLKVTTIDVEEVTFNSATSQSAELYGALTTMIAETKIAARAVLVCIANLTKGEHLEKLWVPTSEIEKQIQQFTNKLSVTLVNGILRDLVSKQILSYRGVDESEMEYCFRVPLLRFYVTEYLKLRDVLREGDYL